MLAMRASLDTHEPQQFPVYVLGQAEVIATVVFKGREHVELCRKIGGTESSGRERITPQGQPISLDFWVDDNRKLIKIAVPSQGVEAYQEGFAARSIRHRLSRDRTTLKCPLRWSAISPRSWKSPRPSKRFRRRLAASFREPLTVAAVRSRAPIPLLRRWNKAATRCTKSCKLLRARPATRTRPWRATSIKRSPW